MSGKNLPNGWTETKFENLVGQNGVFSDGDWVESKDQDPNGDVRLTQLADIGDMHFIDKSHRFMTSQKAEAMKCLYLQKDDLLISRLGDPLGKACLYPAKEDKAVTVVDVCVFRPGHSHVDPLLVGYFLNSIVLRQSMNLQASGTTRKRITGKKIKALPFRLPPLNEQKRIVDKIETLFSDLDKGEELVKQVQKQLATYRQSVLKAAVTGELTKDWRERNKHKLESGEKLLERILKSRRDNWNDRGKYKEASQINIEKFSLLPDGWVWATPDQLKSDEPNALCIGPFGSNLKVSDYKNSGVPLVFVRHIKAKQFEGLKPQFVSKEKAKELSSHRVAGGDLLITKMGEPPGDVCIYPEGSPEAIITADCIRFSSNKDLLNTEYLELAISSQVVQQQIRYITKGVAQQKVTLGNFKVIALPLPGLEEQNEIADLCRDIFSQIDAMEKWCEAGLKRSATLRQSILKDAFSGKLVPQDPADEQASELLKRIQANQDNKPVSTRGRKAKKAKAG